MNQKANDEARMQQVPKVVTTVTNYTVKPREVEIIFAPVDGTSFSVTLPPARTVEGRVFNIRVEAGTVGTLTVTSHAADRVALSIALTASLDYAIVRAQAGQMVVLQEVST